MLVLYAFMYICICHFQFNFDKEKAQSSLALTPWHPPDARLRRPRLHALREPLGLAPVERERLAFLGWRRELLRQPPRHSVSASDGLRVGLAGGRRVEVPVRHRGLLPCQR